MFTKTILAAAVLAAIAAAPAQACGNGGWMSGTNGISFNGAKLNGITFNGTKFNGWELNGTKFNGWQINGTRFNGWQINGTGVNVGGHQGVSFNGTVIAIEF